MSLSIDRLTDDRIHQTVLSISISTSLSRDIAISSRDCMCDARTHLTSLLCQFIAPGFPDQTDARAHLAAGTSCPARRTGAHTLQGLAPPHTAPWPAPPPAPCRTAATRRRSRQVGPDADAVTIKCRRTFFSASSHTQQTRGTSATLPCKTDVARMRCSAANVTV